jgi:hypothetical protein
METDSQSPEPRRTIGFAAAGAAVITAVCVLVGQGAAQFVGLDGPTNGASIASGDAAKTARPNFNTIDFATTGSIKGQTVVISPCTGQPVGP